MNANSERSRSLWMETGMASAPALDRAEQADVVVIGAGIAGLSTAYELASRGRDVVVLDRGAPGGGMTARTTAHLASQLDDFYHALIEMRGAELARIHYESQAAAIDRIEAIQSAEGIDCDFQRIDAYLFAPEGTDASVLEREFEACRSVGQAADWVERAPVAGRDSGRALRFPRQARMHPLKYLGGLAAGILSRNGRLYGETCVTAIDESERDVLVSTALGHQVRAAAAVVATNSPINDRLTINSKQAPYRTYAIAASAPRGSVVDALYWDTLDPYHYVRLQPGAREDSLIVGGEDHRSGLANDMAARFDALERWMRERFPAAQTVTHRWSGQVQEPVDYCAFIGVKPGSKRIYVATGDSGQGMTNGVAASLALADLIVDGQSRWAELYDPARTTLGAAAEFVRENMAVVKNFTEYVTGGDLASLDALPRGEGAVVRQGLKKIAAYRDEAGNLHLRSASCTHAGCVVHWNPLERCWDCPCHGSHFAPDGAALNGPAVGPLDEVSA